MMLSKFICGVLILLLVCCQSSSSDKTSEKKPPIATQCDTTTKFNRADSTGKFAGKVAFFEDTSYRRSSAGLLLTTANNDTINFVIDYNTAKNIEPKRLVVGSCVEVEFFAEIQRVEVDSSEDGKRGDEISRHYYIKEIKYFAP
jgi:hypothetical protein